MKPRLFIGSSTEGLSLAYAAQENLHSVAEVTVWDQGVFQLSATNLESLLACLVTCDFGLFVFTPDDVSTIRGASSPSVRDNVIFELGLFVGVLGRDRCFIFVPEGTPELRIPTDLIGVTPGTYETRRSDGSHQAATGPACNRIRSAIQRSGQRPGRTQPQAQRPEAPEVKTTETNGPPPKSVDSNAEAKVDDAAREVTWFEAYFDNDYEQAQRLLSKEIEAQTDPDDRLDLQCWLGRSKYRLDPTEGSNYLETLISTHPDKPEPCEALIYSHLGRDRFAEALAIVDATLERGLRHTSLVKARVRCLRSLSRDAEIEQTIRMAIVASPHDAELYLELALHYISAKQPERALEALEDGDTAVPNDERILAKYASVLSEQADSSLALVPYQALVKTHPKNPTYRGLQANILLSHDLYDLAMRDYKKASSLANEKQAWLLCNIGNALKNKGFYHDAIEYLNRGLQVDPESEYGYSRLSAALQGRDEEQEKANELLEKARRTLAAHRTQRKQSAT